MVKFLIIGDLHGRKPKIHFKDFDAIIVPGDVCSDNKIRPLAKKWLSQFKDKKKKKINYEDFINKEIGKKKFNNLLKNSLIGGRKILKFLDSFDKPVFFVPGNWDQSYGSSRIKDKDKTQYNYSKYALDIMLGKELNKFVKKGLKNIYDCQFKLFKFPYFNIVGYGLSNFPERLMMNKVKNKKRRMKLKKTYDKMFFLLAREYKGRNRKNPTIFLTHNVPHNTKLDVVLDKKSPIYKKHQGSTIAREFCIKYKPLVCIGGHVHEHFGKDKLGKTTVINAGFGPNVNTLLEVKGNKIKQLKFWKGK